MCFSCDSVHEKIEDINLQSDPSDPKEIQGSFEGEIHLSTSQGLYGELEKVNTTYYITKNKIRRHQQLGGVNSVFGISAGMIIDGEKDSVTLYYNQGPGAEKQKTTLDITSFIEYRKSHYFPISLPSVVDHSFTMLNEYNTISTIKDSTTKQGILCDYTLYTENSRILKQEIFDSKQVNINREWLEMIFTGIPSDRNFVLESSMKTTVSNVSNDTILSGSQTKALNELIRKLAKKQDSTIDTKKSDTEGLLGNKWVNKALNLVKKGIDLSLHVSTELDKVEVKTIESTDLQISGDFTEVSPDEFLSSIEYSGSSDWDD